MKRFLMIFSLFLFVLSRLNMIGETSTTINCNKLFTYPNSMTVNGGKNHDSPQTFTANNFAKPVIINSNQIQQIMATSDKLVITDFPITPTLSKTVTLQKDLPVIDENTVAYNMTKNGKVRVAPMSMTAFYGKIDNDPDSKVYVNYIGGYMFCLIEQGNGEQSFLTPAIGESTKEAHILISQNLYKQEKNNTGFTCLTEDYHGPKTEQSDIINYHKEGIEDIQSSRLLEVGIICEGTFEFYQMLGSDLTKAKAYIAAVIQVSSKIYQQEVNIRIVLNQEPQVYPDKSIDPYESGQTLSDKLNLMPSVWSSASDKRAFVSLFHDLNTQPGNLRIAGIAMAGDPNVGTLCNTNRGYNVFGVTGGLQYPSLNYVWDVDCASHEMGHSFSSPHTHNCYFVPQIDTCITKVSHPTLDGCLNINPVPRLGTIMSYCHLTNGLDRVALFFHDRCRSLIRTAAQSASCIGEPSKPLVSLLNPLGDETFRGDTTIQIRWTYSKISAVTLKYTADNGANWILIKDNINVLDSIYNWTIPKINTTKAKVLIQDAANPLTADTSWRTFTIAMAGVTITKPVAGGRYSLHDPLQIQWQASLLNSFDIEYSTDGGGSWKALANNLSTNTYSWDVTSIKSNNCVVRIKNSGTIYATSGVFAIGQDYVKLIAPLAGYVWCRGWPYRILWDYDFTDNIYIELSQDGGKTWTRKISILPVLASTKYFDWNIPKTIALTDSALIRIYSKTYRNAADSTLSFMTIDSCEKNSVNDEGIAVKRHPLSIVDVTPNPVLGNAVIKVLNNLSENLDANISIVDETGRLAADLGNFSFGVLGENQVNVQMPNLAQGSYFIVINSSTQRTSFPIKILK